MYRTKLQLRILMLLAVMLFILAFTAEWLLPYDPYAADMANTYAGPSALHRLGTDDLGRDVFSRILAGIKPSLSAALLVVTLSNVLGGLLGLLGGCLSGWTDDVVRWLITVFQAFPSFLLAVVITGFAGSGWLNACLALSAVYWASSARLTRSIVLAVKNENYLKSAVMSGNTRGQVMRRHILPNVLPYLAANASGQMGSVIISMSGLSFLGLGAQRPTCEWGVLLSESQKLLRRAPRLLFYYSLALVLLVLLFNLLGDALRDQTDSRVGINESRKKGGIL